MYMHSVIQPSPSRECLSFFHYIYILVCIDPSTRESYIDYYAHTLINWQVNLVSRNGHASGKYAIQHQVTRTELIFPLKNCHLTQKDVDFFCASGYCLLIEICIANIIWIAYMKQTKIGNGSHRLRVNINVHKS